MADPSAPLSAITAIHAGTAGPSTLATSVAPGSTGATSMFDQSLQALHQAAQAPDVVGRGVRAESVGRPSAPLELINHLTQSVLAPGHVEPPPVPVAADGQAMTETALEGMQRVSQFAIQTSIQLASESTMLSVTSALASAANTTFHQLLSSNE